jgi:hypothetical protein
MANKVNVLPNERIDIPDFEGATQEFTDADSKERFQATFQDRYAHVPEGFRVEIPDQGSFPGQVNVHNGLGFDRSGKLVTSGAAPDTQRSIVLTGTTVYYLEVEFTEEESFVDARAFWDPNFDNGADPSGDLRPSGREFDQNVATRKVPEWRIVSPVSTTGFEINSVPSSNKIPLAVIHVSANVVVDGGGPAPIPLRTSLKEDYLAGVSAIKVLNSRSMPQAFTCDIGAESVSVTANDQDNGILTLAGVTVSSHIAGERVTVTGGAVYLPQRTSPKPPTAPGAGGTEDARTRLYSGDEEVGHALLQNADAGTGQSDVQIDNLKNYVDFLAGQIRQLKVGAARGDDIGQTAPPFAFSSDFRYFEDAGGVLGARTNTVSVGDGVNTWGDYNSLQAGSPDAAIQGAIDAVPAGGIVYIKAGTYVLTSALSVTKPIRFVGDGHAVTIIDASAAVTAFDVNTTGAVGFKDIGVTASGTAAYAMTITQCGPKSVFAGCTIEGLTSVDCDQSRFANCDFTTPGSGDDALNGIFTGCVFDQCQFDCGIALATARAVNLSSGSADNAFRRCDFSQSDTTPTSLVEVASENTFDSCQFPVPEDGDGILVSGPGVRIVDCRFDQASSTGLTTGVGVRCTDTVSSPDNLLIKGCAFVNTDIGIWFNDVTLSRFFITHNRFTGASGRGRFGVYGDGTFDLEQGTIDNNVFDGFSDDAGATDRVAGVYFTGVGSVIRLVSITNNKMFNIGIQTASNLEFSFGIGVEDGLSAEDFSFNGNNIRNLYADQVANAVFLGATSTPHERVQISDNSFLSINDTAGDSLGLQFHLGIWVKSWRGLTVSNNRMNNLGNTLATGGPSGTTQAYGILLGADNLAAFNADAVVTGNILSRMEHGGATQYGILVNKSGGEVVIDGNHAGFFLGASISYGIFLNSDNTNAAEFMENVIIANNVLRTLDYGVYIDMLNSLGTAAYENFIVNGNIIDDYDAYGVQVRGLPVTRSANYIVSNNALRTATDDVVGIQLDDLQFLTVTGNVITQNDGYRGIGVFGCIQFSVCGNTIILNAFGAVNHEGIAASSSSYGTVTGNRVESNSGGTGVGISVGANTICGQNNVSKNGFFTPISVSFGTSITGLVNNTGASPAQRLITAGVVASDTNILTP